MARPPVKVSLTAGGHAGTGSTSDKKPIGLPVEAYTDLDYGAIVYGRGPLFLVALSREMGEANFHLFLKNYFTTYSWKVATGQDFQILAETTCSCDLDRLFNEWVTIE